MLPVVWAMLRSYAPIILLPVSAVIGLIGYNLEAILSDKYTPYKPSIEEQREDRQLQELGNNGSPLVETLHERKFVPKSIFERNLSPKLEAKRLQQEQQHSV
ncbi:Small integral membrane protein 12 [Folsomia candida]|uniref:Small integral membrane protein 12 n=1 Tax=Folsomia candida TaxID=158441 RepID=A0A226DAL8_FOLCA|nr:Small integral membrane protein 12 [Folsomia candida]